MLEYEIKDAKTANLNEIFFDKNTNKMSYKNSLGIVTILPSDDIVKSVVAGTNVTVDNTDPANPIVSALGGGGASGIHAPYIISGGSYSYAISATNLTGGISITNNVLRLMPFTPRETFTCSDLYINCTAASTLNLARILIYSNVNNEPNTKLYESADLDLSTTGIKTATTSFTFTAGTTYWMCTHTSGGAASLSVLPNTAVLPIRITGVSNPSTYVSAQTSYPLGSAPTTIGAINYQSGSIFYIGITAA